jgi:hypothetical protein
LLNRVFFKAGRHAQAVVLGEELVETREKLGQKGTQAWLISVNNLGFALNKAGQSQRAVEMLLTCAETSGEKSLSKRKRKRC